MKRQVDVSVCQRGQVWYIPEDREVTQRTMDDPNNSVTAKSRTYLVISCKENNEMSTTINCLVVSTKPVDGYPMHVPFSFTGREMMVQCEQIKTFDIREFTRLNARYNFALTPMIMERVNMALINQLELNQCIPGYSNIMSMIENIANIKAEEIRKKYQRVTEDEVIEVAAKIESMFDCKDETKFTQKEETKLIPNVRREGGQNSSHIPNNNSTYKSNNYSSSTYKPNNSYMNKDNRTQVDKFNNKYSGNSTAPNSNINQSTASAVPNNHVNVSTVPSTSNSSNEGDSFNPVLPSNFKIIKEEEIKQPKQSGRNSWDQEKIKRFLSDCETKTPEEVAKIYGLKDKKSVYTYKYKFKS